MRGGLKIKPVGLLQSTLLYRQQPYPWFYPPEIREGGDFNAPRFHALGEFQGVMPRTWPTPYAWSLMGLGAMPLFQLGPTTPTFNNQLSPAPFGYNWLLPGMNRSPFGGS